MKRITFIFVLIIFGLSIGAFSQNVKIGYVDTNRLKIEYKEFAQAQAKFERQMAKWQAQADSMQAELLKLQEDLNKQRLLLSEEKKREKEQFLLRKQSEYQEFANKILGPEGEAAKREFALSKPLIEKINAAIKLVALRENYTLILDTAGGDILYAEEGMDITIKILEELNQ